MKQGIKGLFRGNIFPPHVADEINYLHGMIFNGTDGEEQWEQHLTPRQKESVAVALARYYHCELCIRHHEKLLFKTFEDTINKKRSVKNMKSMIFFLRLNTDIMNEKEQTDWGERWDKYIHKVEIHCDPLAPHLIGLAIGMARNDNFLIKYCGTALKNRCKHNQEKFSAIIGELYAVVVFMKAATSKNRLTKKLEGLIA